MVKVRLLPSCAVMLVVPHTIRSAAAPVTPVSPEPSPFEYMLAIMRDEAEPRERRDAMAIAAAPYVRAPQADQQRKEPLRPEA